MVLFIPPLKPALIWLLRRDRNSKLNFIELYLLGSNPQEVNTGLHNSMKPG